MDIKSLHTAEAHEEGAEMQIRGPDGVLIDAFITLVGRDSKTWRDTNRKYERIILMADKDDDRDMEAAALSEAVISWRGLIDDGKDYACNPKNAYDLFINAPYIKDQVNEFVGKRANFMKK